ncbi:hypothetical protein COY28_05175 [Candidatus Woesearchaeota archaeon CG_4_10_14_0_2_um_filter_57_5]|nr:MAG: hypothetical protein AUJ68_06605 [Candidatus Woesearchaeota archaeon CG1_02_57_44]PIN70281.1 MAG: hypothetical protein COV94_01890 [Candidatus Woesearchaeota archaeon CG11_big_fil_rev_8_21_14_0_20_57_5]PIZ51158.1 MAG: hypothetical protein COY28_05175 [Candidatus Woesearchaeota archaeon CG_4_10_14_0_2_um_filter_57_5]
MPKPSAKNPAKSAKPRSDPRPYLAIVGIICGVSIPLVAITAAMAESWVIVPVVGFLAFMGIMLGFFASRER